MRYYSGSSAFDKWKYLPEAYRLQHVPWQVFATLTFKSKDIPQIPRVHAVFAWLRSLAKRQNVYFPKLLFCFRFELGRSDQHPHYHVLVAGLPSFGKLHCRFARDDWHAQSSAVADVQVFDPARGGGLYVLKRTGHDPCAASSDIQNPDASRGGGPNRNKNGHGHAPNISADEVEIPTLSESLVAYLKHRLR